MISGLALADSGHMEKGSGMQAKQPAHEKSSDSEAYQSGKAGYIEEGSGGLKPVEKNSDYIKRKRVVTTPRKKTGTVPRKMQSSAPRREGS